MRRVRTGAGGSPIRARLHPGTNVRRNTQVQVVLPPERCMVLAT